MKRMKDVQTGQPSPLHLVASFPVETDLKRIEAQVHAYLHHARQRGEWFDVQIADNAHLEQLIVQAVQYVAEQEKQHTQAREQALPPMPIEPDVVGKRIIQL